jgi:hypothetical protein
MKLYFYLFFLLLFPVACFAQVTISGRIIGQSDTKSVANASVFLNNATNGTKTADDGTFTLKGVKAGKYQLIVSIIGFDSYNQEITVNQDNVDLHDITIFPKTIALNEVKITPKDESGREIYLGLFKQYFLGTSGLAESCDIINPQALYLDYDEDTKTLTASTNDFLEIKNQALGYKVKYLLKEFTLNRMANEIHYEGPVLFEPLQGAPSQQKRWEKNREEVYYNSSMHFLRSLAAGDFTDEGFQVQLVTGAAGSVQQLITMPLSLDDFFKRTDQKGVYDLYSASGSLFVSYSKNHRFSLKTALARINDPTNRNSTLVAFNSPNSLFQSNGVLLNPGNVVFSGAWGNNRVAELLPSDYEPPKVKSHRPIVYP